MRAPAKTPSSPAPRARHTRRNVHHTQPDDGNIIRKYTRAQRSTGSGSVRVPTTHRTRAPERMYKNTYSHGTLHARMDAGAVHFACKPCAPFVLVPARGPFHLSVTAGWSAGWEAGKCATARLSLNVYAATECANAPAYKNACLRRGRVCASCLYMQTNLY